MSYSASGIFYFSKALDEDNQNETAFFIIGEAAKRRLGIELGYNIPQCIVEKYKKLGSDIPVSEKHLVFNLSESGYYRNCDKLFEPIYYERSDGGFCVMGIELEHSRLSDIQDFFATVIGNPFISSIRFDFELSFAPNDEFMEYKIKADDFCRAINNGFREQNTDCPAIRLLISK